MHNYYQAVLLGGMAVGVGLYFGELAALAAACMWAVAAVLFRQAGTSVSPLHLNLIKGSVATTILCLWLIVTSLDALLGLTATQLGLLLVSGAVGIGIGDTAFFAALNKLGEQQTVLLAETLAPPMTAILAFLWLAETLSLLSVAGIIVTVGGVAWVITEQKAGKQTRNNNPQLRWQRDWTRPVVVAILLAVLAAICQSVGAVISRQVLQENSIGPAASSLVRLVGGLMVLAIVIPLRGRRTTPHTTQGRWSATTLGLVGLATLLGTLIGIVCQQTSLMYTSAGVSQTLIATSALFVLPLAILCGQRVSLRAVIGGLVAVAGIGLLFLGKLQEFS